MSDQHLIEQKQDDVAEPFARMAEQIRHNKDTLFGGAIVLVPPQQGGSNIETLMLSQSDPVVFWSTCKSLVDRALDSLAEQSKQQQAFQRR
jgi:hypothetical protein